MKTFKFKGTDSQSKEFQRIDPREELSRIDQNRDHIIGKRQRFTSTNVGRESSLTLAIFGAPASATVHTSSTEIPLKSSKFVESLIWLITDDFASTGFSIQQPIPAILTWDRSSGEWYVSDTIFDEYGSGKTQDEAKQACVRGLLTYYRELEERATAENAATRVQFKQLRAYIRKENAS